MCIATYAVGDQSELMGKVTISDRVARAGCHHVPDGKSLRLLWRQNSELRGRVNIVPETLLAGLNARL